MHKLFLLRSPARDGRGCDAHLKQFTLYGIDLFLYTGFGIHG